MSQGLANRVNLIRGQPPFEHGLPDCRVFRPALETVVEPPPGFVESTGPDGQIGPTQPDAVVIRSLLAGTFQEDPERIHGDRVEIHPDSVVKQAQCLLGVGPIGLTRESPARLDHGPHRVGTPLLPVEPGKDAADHDRLAAGTAQRPQQQRLSRGESSPVHLENAGIQGRRLGKQGPRRQTAPGRERRLIVAQRPLAPAQSIVDPIRIQPSRG